MKKYLLPVALAIPFTLAACGSSPSVEEVTKSCQDQVSTYAKYPGTADWVEVLVAEEQNGKIYIAGSADFNNDAGNPVRTNYHCTLDIESDQWVRRPSLEPHNPVASRWGHERWGGSKSPMLEKYGDSMSLES